MVYGRGGTGSVSSMFRHSLLYRSMILLDASEFSCRIIWIKNQKSRVGFVERTSEASFKNVMNTTLAASDSVSKHLDLKHSMVL